MPIVVLLFMLAFSSPALAYQAAKGSVELAGTQIHFSSNEASAVFECRLDAGPWIACQALRAVALVEGDHLFEVRARDAAGNVDPTPARRVFTLGDLSAPDTSLDVPHTSWFPSLQEEPLKDTSSRVPEGTAEPQQDNSQQTSENQGSETEPTQEKPAQDISPDLSSTTGTTPSDISAPTNLSPPSLALRKEAATYTLECSPGEWRSADKVSFAWRVNGDLVDHTDSLSLDDTALTGKNISCHVTAENAGGTAPEKILGPACVDELLLLAKSWTASEDWTVRKLTDNSLQPCETTSSDKATSTAPYEDTKKIDATTTTNELEPSDGASGEVPEQTTNTPDGQ